MFACLMLSPRSQPLGWPNDEVSPLPWMFSFYIVFCYCLHCVCATNEKKKERQWGENIYIYISFCCRIAALSAEHARSKTTAIFQILAPAVINQQIPASPHGMPSFVESTGRKECTQQQGKAPKTPKACMTPRQRNIQTVEIRCQRPRHKSPSFHLRCQIEKTKGIQCSQQWMCTTYPMTKHGY